jgi:DNA polymerase
VFGKGSRAAAILLVGEQPGDVEDKRGVPFVGPAGAVLWSCLEDAGVERRELFATNAVKHFKHTIRGKRRLHKRPATDEIEACHPWLEAEIAAVGPRVIVALGAVAARSLLGHPVPIAASRKRTFEVDGIPVCVTYHPSAVLRADERADEIRSALVEDLAAARQTARTAADSTRR